MPRVPKAPTVTMTVDGEERTIDPLQVDVIQALQVFDSKADAAEFFGVHRSQPGKWARGTVPAGDVARQVMDVAYLWSIATREMSDDAVRNWLRSDNTLLDTTPLEAVRRGRIAAVRAAWDAYMAGSYT